MSIDDKARVALGYATATLQVPIFMCLDYEPDISFVVGERHNLTPSVNDVCNVSKKGVVT